MDRATQTQEPRAIADVAASRPAGKAPAPRASRIGPGSAASSAHRPAQPSAEPPGLVLDVHLQLTVRAEDSSVLASISAGGADRGHDLVVALLGGALHCLTGNGDGAPPSSHGPVDVQPRTGVFRRQGEYWAITYDGRSFLLKDMKGLRHLARLLTDPDREFHALDLVRLEEGLDSALPERGEDPQASVRGFGDAGELLDSRAKRAYRQRLIALRDELDVADPELRARLREEMDMLAHQLGAAMGIGGRDVKAASAAERARLNVTNRIKAAIDKITIHDSVLGRHLDASVRTGTFCSYCPEPTARIVWTM